MSEIWILDVSWRLTIRMDHSVARTTSAFANDARDDLPPLAPPHMPHAIATQIGDPILLITEWNDVMRMRRVLARVEHFWRGKGERERRRSRAGEESALLERNARNAPSHVLIRCLSACCSKAGEGDARLPPRARSHHLSRQNRSGRRRRTTCSPPPQAFHLLAVAQQKASRSPTS